MKQDRSDLKKFMFRVVYNQIVSSNKSQHAIKYRMFTPKKFCNRIGKNPNIVKEFGSATKALAWMVEEGYLIQTKGRNTTGVYFQITDKFSDELYELWKLKLTLPFEERPDERRFKKVGKRGRASPEQRRTIAKKLFGERGEALAEMSEKRLGSKDGIKLSEEDKTAFLKKFKDI